MRFFLSNRLPKNVWFFSIAFFCLLATSPKAMARLDLSNQISKKIRIVVIDTGCDTEHPLLKNYINKKLVWNSLKDNQDVSDLHGHGTHITGLIVQQLNNSLTEIEVIPIKFFNTNNSIDDTSAATIKAFEYAGKLNPDIVNFSGGGPTPLPAEKIALEKLAKLGTLVVVASGNFNQSLQKKSFYPASYPMPHLLRVASHSWDLSKSEFSNFDSKTVDISAPGEEMVSTLPGGGQGPMSGTSQATAVMTGIAAKVMFENLAFRRSPEKLILHLKNTSQNTPKQKDINKSSGVVSAKKSQLMKASFWEEDLGALMNVLNVSNLKLNMAKGSIKANSHKKTPPLRQSLQEQ